MSVSQPAVLKNPRKAGRTADVDDEATGSRSLRRALDILDLMLQRGGPLTVAQIIEGLSIPKSTTYELVRTLSEANCIAPSARGNGYYLGLKLYEFGMAYRSHVDLLRDGTVRDTVMYSILRSEWPAIRQRLEARLRNGGYSGPGAGGR